MARSVWIRSVCLAAISSRRAEKGARGGRNEVFKTWSRRSNDHAAVRPA